MTSARRIFEDEGRRIEAVNRIVYRIKSLDEAEADDRAQPLPQVRSESSSRFDGEMSRTRGQRCIEG